MDKEKILLKCFELAHKEVSERGIIPTLKEEGLKYTTIKLFDIFKQIDKEIRCKDGK